MKKLTNIILAAVSAFTIQSCFSTRSTTGNGSLGNDSVGRNSVVGSGTVGNGTVGSPNTPGNTRSVTTTRGTTPNTTGPTPDASSMASSGSKKSPAAKSTSGSPGADVQQFIREAALSGISAVQLSQLAFSKTKNATVKDFAATIVERHNQANEDLKSLAASKNVILTALDGSGTSIIKGKSSDAQDSSAINSLNAEMTKLTNASAEQFDKQYIEMMMEDRRKAVSVFEQGIESGDSAVKAYAEKYLPALKGQLKEVSSFNSKTGGSTSSSASP